MERVAELEARLQEVQSKLQHANAERDDYAPHFQKDDNLGSLPGESGRDHLPGNGTAAQDDFVTMRRQCERYLAERNQLRHEVERWERANAVLENALRQARADHEQRAEEMIARHRARENELEDKFLELYASRGSPKPGGEGERENVEVEGLKRELAGTLRKLQEERLGREAPPTPRHPTPTPQPSPFSKIRGARYEPRPILPRRPKRRRKSSGGNFCSRLRRRRGQLAHHKKEGMRE